MIEVTIPVPPSANALFANRTRGSGRVKTREYKAWLEDAGYHVRLAWAAQGKPEIENHPMQLMISAGIGRHRDLSNCCKAIEDLLVSVLPVPDDRWNDRIFMRRKAEVDGLAYVNLAPLDST